MPRTTARVDSSEFMQLAEDLAKLPVEIVKEAGEYYKSITPVKSGNARRKTTTQGNSIVSDYPYAGRLDSGYSRQAPQGMSGPTITYIQKIANSKIGGL